MELKHIKLTSNRAPESSRNCLIHAAHSLEDHQRQRWLICTGFQGRRVKNGAVILESKAENSQIKTFVNLPGFRLYPQFYAVFLKQLRKIDLMGKLLYATGT